MSAGPGRFVLVLVAGALLAAGLTLAAAAWIAPQALDGPGAVLPVLAAAAVVLWLQLRRRR